MSEALDKSLQKIEQAYQKLMEPVKDPQHLNNNSMVTTRLEQFQAAIENHFNLKVALNNIK